LAGAIPRKPGGRNYAAEKRKISSYRDLIVWQKGMELSETVYGLTRKLPAEGFGRHALGEYLQHLSIANGSVKELETHLFLCVRLRYLQQEEVAGVIGRCEEIGRILAAMSRKLRARKTGN